MSMALPRGRSLGICSLQLVRRVAGEKSCLRTNSDVHSDWAKCLFWARPSSTLLTSSYCWTVGSWMLQIKITSLTNQNNPSSLQGSDPFHWRGRALFNKAGNMTQYGPRARQIAADTLKALFPTTLPSLHKVQFAATHPVHSFYWAERMEALKGWERLWCIALCWPLQRGENIP